jgi:non-heme chloroperoxidase
VPNSHTKPINISGKKSARLIKGAKELFYPGLPHGLTATNADQVNADLLEFLKSVQKVRKAASA